MPAPKTISGNRSFQTYLGTPRGFLIPNTVKTVNAGLLKRGFAGMSYRDMQLLGQLAKAGLYNDSCVQHYMAAYGVTQSSNAVSSWLNLAPSRITLNKNLEQVTAANRPTWLQHGGGVGNNYGYLPGITGAYYSTPDSAAVSITGDIDLRFDLLLNDWTPAAASFILGKGSVAGNLGYSVLDDTSGAIRFDISVNGTANSVVFSDAPSFTNLTRYRIRITRASATGIVTYYTSTDFSNWTQLGATKTTTSGNIYDSTAQLGIGANTPGTGNLMAGLVYRAQIYNGIAGTLVFDFNPAAYVSGTTFLDSSANAATITLNGGAVINTSPSIYFDGSNDYLKTGPFTLAQPETVYFVGKQVSWTSGDYIFDGNSANTMALDQHTSSPNTNISAPTHVADNAGWVIQTNAVVTAVFNGASSALRINRGAAATGDAGSNGANGFSVGSLGGAVNFGNIIASEILVFNTAHDTATQNIVIGYLNDKYSLGV